MNDLDEIVKRLRSQANDTKSPYGIETYSSNGGDIDSDINAVLDALEQSSKDNADLKGRIEMMRDPHYAKTFPV